MEKLESGDGEEKAKLERWEVAVETNRKWISMVCVIGFVAVMIALLVLGIYFCTLIFSEKKLRGILLPKSIVPHHYKLEIQPHFGPDFVFNGSVEIRFACREKTDTIIFHAKNLSLSLERIKIQCEKGHDVPVLKMENDEELNFVILTLMDDLLLENYTLFMEFEGILQEELHGFYYYSYTNDDNVTEYAALTQFEAIHARESFPCFDEPQLKATFDISIVRWSNMTALSNMPKLKSEIRKKVWVADVFRTSKKMSTYLVAFVIGNFTKNENGKIRAWSSPDKISEMDYALEVANKVLPFFEKLLRVPYSLPKLDMVSIKEFEAGGMENWGIITYNEDEILFKKERNDDFEKERVAKLVLHEIAHQWFGNLVTMKWWNDLWLNEGITTYMEQIAWEYLFPEWNKINTFIFGNAFSNNLFRYSVAKPVEDRKDVADIDSIFGPSTYEKGSSVIQMAHHILGNDTFWRGISNYLHANSYSNVEEHTLWKYLTEAQRANKFSRLNLSEVMSPWIHLESFPILTITRDYEKHTALITQASKMEKNDDLWPIPIYYTTGDKPNWNSDIKMWMKTKNVTIRNVMNSNQWLYVDGTKLAFTLINYDRKNWELLAAQLQKNHWIIPIDQRFKLLTDAITLLRSNVSDCDIVLDLHLYLRKEELNFFTFGIYEFIQISEILLPDHAQDNRKEFLFSFLIPLYKQISFEDLDEYSIGYKKISYIQGRLVETVCKLEYPPCIKEAQRKYNIWKSKRDNNTEISYTIKTYVLCVGIRYGDEDDWNYLYESYLKSIFIIQPGPLLCTRNETLKNKILDLLLDKDHFLGVLYSAFQFREYWPDLARSLDENFISMSESDPNQLRIFVTVLLKISDIRLKVLEIVQKHLKDVSEENKKKIKDFLKEEETEAKKDKELKECFINWLNKKKWLH